MSPTCTIDRTTLLLSYTSISQEIEDESMSLDESRRWVERWV